MKSRRKGKSNNSVASPKVLLDYVLQKCNNNIFFDPCPLNPNWIVDGLKLNWGKHKYIYVNPPFSNVKLWILKAKQEFQTNNNIQKILFLMKAECLGNNYSHGLENMCNIYCITNKLKFVGYTKTCGFSTVLLEFTRDKNKFWKTITLS